MKMKPSKKIVVIGQVVSMTYLFAAVGGPFDCWFPATKTCAPAVNQTTTCPNGGTAFTRCNEGPQKRYCTSFGLGSGSQDCVQLGTMTCTSDGQQLDCGGTYTTWPCVLLINPTEYGPGTTPCWGG